MAKVSLSVAELLAQQFGSGISVGNALELNGAAIPTDAEKKGLRTKSGASPYWGTDVFGREFYMPVTLGGMQLPSPVISIRGKKRLIETPLVEREGEVNELINIEGYLITIRGTIVDANRQFPEDQVKALNELFRRSEALEIISPITEVHLPTSSDGTRRVIITDYDFPEGRSSVGSRNYMLAMKSNLDFNLFEIA